MKVMTLASGGSRGAFRGGGGAELPQHILKIPYLILKIYNNLMHYSIVNL